MPPVSKFARSLVTSAVGGWLIIIGIASVLAARELIPADGPIPLVGGIERYIFAAATIAALRDAGYITIITGLVAVAIAALHRATHHQTGEAQPIRDQRIIFEDTASRPS